MSADQQRAILWCLDSEIKAFGAELAARGGGRRDAYGNPVHDAVLAHLRLLESARAEVVRIKVNG